MLVVRELGDKYQLIDGHLRAETITTQPVPCVVLDVNENETEMILSTFDPISQLAAADNEQLVDLLTGVSSSSDVLGELLEQMKDLAEEEVMMAIDPLPKDELLTHPEDEELVVITLTLTVGQNEQIRHATNYVKKKLKTETTGEAVAYIVKEWFTNQGS